MSEWHAGDVYVRWLHGGLYIETHGVAIVLDAPPQCAELLTPAQLSRVQAIALSSGRMRSLGGLVGLLYALEPHRRADLPLSMRVAIGEERGVTLADSWVRAWPDSYPLAIDSERPGAQFDVGPLEIRTVPMITGDPRWLPTPTVKSQSGLAFLVSADGKQITFAPGAGSPGAVMRLASGSDLAVIEVGKRPWPPSERPWRLTLAEATRAATTAKDAWIVGDDGEFAGVEA